MSGRKLAKPVTFRFSTPTVRLENVQWYRRGGTVDGRIVLLLTFNQPVRSADIAAALSARFEPHPWEAPKLTPEQASALRAADPSAVERFEAKVKETQLAASSRAPVKVQPTTDWNRRAYPASPRMVAFEVVSDVAPDGWLRLALARTVRSPAGPATPRAVQTHTVETEKAFFVTGFECYERCDADRRNPLKFTTKVDVEAFAAGISVVDATSGKPVPRQDQPKENQEERYEEYENALSLEDAGYQAQPPQPPLHRHGPLQPEVGRRADARLHVGGIGRQLASLRVHELRRRTGRVGKGRRSRAAVLRAQPSGRHAVGVADPAGGPDDAVMRARRGEFSSQPPEPGHDSQARRDARSDSVARPRRVGIALERDRRVLGRGS